jgi:hypothetical protein
VGQDRLGEVYSGQKVRLVILKVIDEGTETLIDILVKDLRVSIGLGVVGR